MAGQILPAAKPIMPPTLGQKLLMWGTDTAAFKWLDNTVTPAAEKIEATKTAVAKTVNAVQEIGVSGIASGVKTGLIIIAVILALFLVAQIMQVKSGVAAAFKAE